MYESRKQPLLDPPAFLRRLLVHLAAALVLLGGSVAIGMAGYVHFERLPPVDAFLDTAMLLGGMGPVHPPQTFAGKLFAGFFALYAGLVFIVTAALALGPVVHRVLHRFHLDKG
jgi:hypothetical protein